MLYERWRQVALHHGSNLALWDLHSNRAWSFAELLETSEEAPGNPAFPQGAQAGFVLTLLRAWKNRSLVCPLEPGQPRPPLNLGNLPSDCVHLKTTSATTGPPALIAFTAEQLAADVDNIVATMGLRPDWPNLGVISLAHSYGFSNLVLPLCLHGIPLILAPGPFPEILRRTCAEFPAITLPAVPALWRAWYEADVIGPQIRLAISAGAPLGLELEQQIFQRHRLKIHNFYGASESGGIAYDRTKVPRTDGACVGAPLENVRLSLGPSGCLEVRSAAVGATYWPEARSALESGCFKTSDLAELTGDLVHLRGRAGDQIMVAGRKVAPETIEEAIRSHPSVRECTVFGVPASDPGRVEIIVACLVLHPSAPLAQVQSHVRSLLPSWQTPREWWAVHAIPSSPRGKTSRAELRARFLKERNASSRPGAG